MKKDILKDKLYRGFFGSIIFTVALTAYDSLSLYSALLYFILLSGLFIGWRFVQEEKYLEEWEFTDNTFTFHYRINLLSKRGGATFVKDKVDSVRFSSKDHYMSPFHEITIKYLTDENIYEVLELKVKPDEDWIAVLDKLSNPKEAHNLT